jgi:hypothetical protein
MATDAETIVNSAFDKLGVEAISSLSDNTPQARWANRNYTRLRDKLLKSYLWKFAIKRSSLTLDASSPDFEWENNFILPADFLFAWYVYDETSDWNIEGEFLVSDADEVELVYIAQITDTTKFEIMFEEALAYLLAEEGAYKFIQSATLAELMANKAKQVLRNARSINSQQGTPQSLKADECLVVN